MLKRNSDLEWLEERFFYMEDIIRESPFYQWVLEKGREQDLAQMRQTIMDFVKEDFPELVQLAEEVVATIDDLPRLGRLSIKLGGVQSAEQARKILSQLAQ
jgi:hypothetical protein